MPTLRLDVVKPDGSVLSESVEECIIPGTGGYFGVRAGHAPFLTLLGVGELMYRVGATQHYIALSGGFCEVRPDQVTVLAENAEPAGRIDRNRAERARDRAESHLQSLLARAVSSEDLEAAQLALKRAQARLLVVDKDGSAGPGN